MAGGLSNFLELSRQKKLEGEQSGKEGEGAKEKEAATCLSILQSKPIPQRWSGGRADKGASL